MPRKVGCICKKVYEGGVMKTITEGFGSYRLRIDYKGNDFAQVTIEDVAQIRFPLMWSRPMTYAQANGALALFKMIGFFEMPID